MVRRLAVFIVLALAAPSAAHAADVSAVGGVLRYTAAPGKISNVTFVEGAAGTVTISRGDKDDDVLSVQAPECTPGPGTGATCVGVKTATIDAGDMADRVTAGALDTATPPNFTGLKTITTTIN